MCGQFAVGATALTIAARNCFHSAIRLLVDHQSDVNAKDSYGCTALIRACAKCGQPQMGFVHHLKIVASVNPPAVALRKHETVLLLLQLKAADVNAITKNGKTVLDYCSHWGSGRCEKNIITSSIVFQNAAACRFPSFPMNVWLLAIRPSL
jgi:ankyrin repeat protein